jgi:hypothetical protein
VLLYTYHSLDQLSFVLSCPFPSENFIDELALVFILFIVKDFQI